MSRRYHHSFFALLCLVSAAVIGNGVSAAERGTLLYEYWTGIGGNTVSALTADARFPLSPNERSYLTSFESGSRGDNYGARLRATLHPDQTGEYRFLIAGDDYCELWLSSSADPSQKQRIAHVPGYTAVRQWTRYTQQQSVAITLTAGAAYYIEAIHKEGVGGDHLAVAWTGPGIGDVPTVIAGAYLSPWPAPIITGDRTFTESTSVSITATVPDATIVYTIDGSQPTATSPPYVAPFTVSDFTVVTAGILTADGTVNADVVRVVFRKVGTGTGLSAQYYANENLSGTPIERLDPVVNFNWGNSAPLTNFPSNNFSVRWQGEIETFLSEPHTLTVRSDDGVRVWINGVLIINDWTYHSAKDVSCVLPAGRHALDIEYKEGTGSAVAQLLWSSARIPREIVPSTQLYPLTGVRGTIPPSSAVSPYYLQVAHRPAPSATVNGVATPMRQLDDLIHYLNVPLSPDQPTPVTISGEVGEPLSGAIGWASTLVSGHTETVIRAGDSLLLNFPQAGNLSITTSSGTYLPTQAVTEGQLKPVRFTAGGIYVVRLISPEGIEVATLDVMAVAADLSGTVLAEVGYTRAVTVPILPANASVTFLGNSQLTVATNSIAQNLADLRIAPKQRGTPRLQARINGPTGPLIAEQEIHEFTIDQTALKSVHIDAYTNIGTNVLVMRPFISNQKFTFTMFAHSATFAGGARTLTIDTNGGPSSTGEAPMVQKWDATTNETIGVFRFDLEVPEYESKYCFRVARQQLPAHQTGAYLPTTTGGAMLSHVGVLTASKALLMASHEPAAPDGPTTNVNGEVCRCQIEAPAKVCAGSVFQITVNLVGNKTTDEEITIELKGTADAHFDTATGPKVKKQKSCPSVGVYNIHPGTVGAKKIEVWVGTELCKEIEVVKLDLVSLEFTTDYQVLRDKKDNHKAGGKVYTAPEWTKAGVNNPIVHQKNTKISLRLIAQYDALTDDTHTSEGKVTNKAWLHFGPTTGALKPGQNTLEFTGEVALPDKIMNDAGAAIEWTIAITPCTYTFTTGPHRIYVVAALPYASSITEWRIDWTTKQCDGLSDADACLLKFAQFTQFNLQNYVGNVEDPSWSLAAGVKADCISQVHFWNRALAMLGWAQGQVRYCYPTLGKNAKVSARDNAWETSQIHGQLGYFASDFNPADPNAWMHFNNFEATLLYNGKYWLGGGSGVNKATPLEVMKAVCKRSIWRNGGAYSLAEDW